MEFPYVYRWANQEKSILIREDSSDTYVSIPVDPDNRDYAEFLKSGQVAKPYSLEVVVTWDTIRAKRDQLIRDSDWTMIPGATVDQRSWSAYRQILRDLPQTYPTPESVIWPEVPSTAGPNTNLE